ncbi:MAG: 3-deoxy-manno-octulosonate cytidylyltransferase [Myxococcales bacterium]|nr:3-deoxy-manno-octulosonate cytidylyltransferase [Myxococcales bacterium]
MTAVGVIPARYAASRFPGKPLARIAGRSMIERVWQGARRAKSLRAVIVATDDARIEAACRGFGAVVVRTRADHATGTDRLSEVALQLDDDIVVNIQGDEPLIEGFAIDAAVEALRADPEVEMATVVHALESEARDDPNRVKVVLDRSGRALYFSRSPIPYVREDAAAPALWQHVGLYAYRRPFLLEFVHWPPTPAERAEGLEQLRALEHGHAIRCAVVEGWRSLPVDVPGDIARVEARLAEIAR